MLKYIDENEEKIINHYTELSGADHFISGAYGEGGYIYMEVTKEQTGEVVDTIKTLTANLAEFLDYPTLY